jgi:hypothetical protein
MMASQTIEGIEMSEPVKIAIVLEGGSLSAVLSAGVPVQFVLIDYDTDDAHHSDRHAIPQTNPDGSANGTAEAIGYIGKAEIGGDWVLNAFAAIAPSHDFRKAGER